MEFLKNPLPVKFLAAVTYSNNEILTQTKNALNKRYGKIDIESEPFAFDHTQYYKKEIGPEFDKTVFQF